jgi:hypothetical protein
MTLIIQKPTGAKLVMAKNYPADDDSRAYIAAVEAADGQSLESGVKMAIDAFVLGCKADGVWTAIKASCILAGARTLAGALVPLVGAAPTNVDGLFVAGDYNRKTGLVGDGSTKYLDSNRNNNSDPQNSNHNAIYATSVGADNPGGFPASAMGSDHPNAGSNVLALSNVRAAGTRNRNSTFTVFSFTTAAGLLATSRSASGSYIARNGGTNLTVDQASSSPDTFNILVFRRQGTFPASTNSRLAFYSIGESLDLALLDARVTDLINAIGAAIP